MYIDKEYTINAELLHKLIKKHKEKIKRWDKLEEYYLGKHDILDRDKEERSVFNNKVVVNHAKYITDISSGYLMGKKVDYQTNSNIDKILESYNYQTINDIDTEIATNLSIKGLEYEYVYNDEEGNPKSSISLAQNTILVRDDTVEHNKLFGFIYESDEKDHQKYYITLVDEEKKYKYILIGNNLILEEEEEHFFGDVPIIQYRNNPEGQGDFEPVLSLIDAYNLLQSDRLNDKEQLVDAILLIKGSQLDEEDLKTLKKFRALTLGEGESAEYLIKQLNEADTDVLRQVIEQDIHKVSMTPNMTDETFSSNLSGVAIKYKLLAFEQKTIKKERYFEKGLKERFKLYNHFLNIKSNVPIVRVEDIDVVFTRNLPINDLEIAQMIAMLQGIVDDETLIQRLSFVDDASEIVKLVEKKKQDNMKNYLGQYGDIREEDGSGDENEM